MGEKLDGYWLRMGNMLLDSLIERKVIPSVLSAGENSALAEYLGGLLSDAHDMGMRLGEARGRFAATYGK